MQNRIVNDNELISRLQRGDEWIFQLLVRRFREHIFAIAFGITLDSRESEKIVKEVFLSAYHGASQFDGDVSLSTWLYRIAVNRCFTRKRCRTRKSNWKNPCKDDLKDIYSDLFDGESLSGRKRMDEEKAIKAFDNALKFLPDQVRTVYVLREAIGLSLENIGEVIGVRVGVARTRMFHARQKLCALFQPLDEG